MNALSKPLIEGGFTGFESGGFAIRLTDPQRFAALDPTGYSEITVQIVAGQEHAIEDWGRIRRTFA